MNDFWLCPKCRLSLSPSFNDRPFTRVPTADYTENPSIKLWQCKNLHSFDVAKEGYVNLLLANQKNSKEPGDSQAMISARRAFLNQGHFKPLLIKLADIIHHHFQVDQIQNRSRILDLGCGEGYYLANLVSLVEEKGIKLETLGVDIAKTAIVKASKRMRVKHNLSHQFAVASSYNLPICPDSVDVCLQVFAPSSEPEVAKVVKQSGLWIKVEPAAKHLYELKSAVYKSPEEHNVLTKTYKNWQIEEQSEIAFTIALDNSDIRYNLLSMTPFKWKMPNAKQNDLLRELLSVTANFSVTVLRKKNSCV